VTTETALFRVESGGQVDLTDLPTTVKPLYTSHKNYKKKLSSLQRLHYASDHWALLLIFQGMDAAGKDGAIRHVMSGVNPQGLPGVQLQTTHRPGTRARLPWRTSRCLPERGRIGIFNGSYYE